VIYGGHNRWLPTARLASVCSELLASLYLSDCSVRPWFRPVHTDRMADLPTNKVFRVAYPFEAEGEGELSVDEGALVLTRERGACSSDRCSRVAVELGCAVVGGVGNVRPWYRVQMTEATGMGG